MDRGFCPTVARKTMEMTKLPRFHRSCPHYVNVATQPTGADHSRRRKRLKFHWLCRTEFQTHLSTMFHGEYAKCPFFGDGSGEHLHQTAQSRSSQAGCTTAEQFWHLGNY